MTNTSSNWQEKLVAAIKADPKKTTILIALGVLLAVMVSRMLLNSQRGPAASARAAGLPAASAASSAASGAATGARSTPAAAALQKWSDAAVPPISRNLFNVRIEYFPVDGSRTTQSSATEGGFWSRLEKSLALQADQRDKRENLKANFRAQAAQLKLQSTMPGPQPRALVNGELVGEGSVVAGFRVLKIEARRIEVEREGIKLEIQMK